MVFVEHQAVEAHFFGIDLLIEIAVVQLCSQFWVINIVADGQVHDGLAGGTEVARLRILVWPFGKVPNKHRQSLLLGYRSVEPATGVVAWAC